MPELQQDQLTTGRSRPIEGVCSAPTSKRGWPTLAIFLSCLFLYLQLFVLPSAARLANGDQAIYLNNGARMLAGQIIYRDYDHFTLPGTDVTYMALFWLFGMRAWIPQAMLIVLGTSLVWLIVVVSTKVMTLAPSLLIGLLFVTLPFSSCLDASHHWYSTVGITAALAVLMEKRSLARIIGAGVLSGVATFFTQSVALCVLGFAVFFLWEHRVEKTPRALLLEKEVALVVSFLATLTACLAYFVWKVGLKRLFYFAVVFVVKYFPADWYNNWRVYGYGRPGLRSWTTCLDVPAFALVHLLIPLIYVLVFVRYSRRANPSVDQQWRRLMLINLTGFVLFLSIASAPAYTRLYAVSPPAVVLLVWLVNSSPKFGHGLLRLLWATVLIMAITRPLVTQLRWKAFLDLPTGRTAFFEPTAYEKCKWVSERTRPGEYFLGDIQIAFSLMLRNPTRVAFLRPTDYTRPEEVQDAVEGLQKFQVRLVSGYIGLGDGKDADAARHPEGNHLAPIRQYVHEHYRLAQTFSDGDQMWERTR
jgi:hypothetical protein